MSISIAAGFLLFTAPAQVGSPFALLDANDMEFLRGLTAAVLEESRVYPGASVGDIGPNTSGGVLIRPGGRGAYPAFWIRDYAMSLDSGMIPAHEQRHMLFIAASHQPDKEIALPTGSLAPVGSIPDHVSFGGTPIYYPGVLQEYDAQGGPRFGILPCLDDCYFFVHMARQYAEATGETAFLYEEVNGKSLLQRLEEAYQMPPSDPVTGFVHATEERRGVNFGFFDVVVHTGDLLFCSLLKYRASLEMADLLLRVGEPHRAQAYTDRAKTLKQALATAFNSPSGLMAASTGLSAQPDVWGSAFALYVDALPEPRAEAVRQALAKCLREGSITWKGGVRHVPTTADYSPETAWERCYAKKNRYQNGAYWNTPLGWLCYAVYSIEPELARKTAREYIEQLRQDDCRKGADFGSPWECMHEEENHRQNPVYLTSVACPFAAFTRISHQEVNRNPTNR